MLKIFNKIKLYRNSQNIDINEVKEIIKDQSNAVLLDVRSPLEFKEGHLYGAINIPLYELELKCKCNKCNAFNKESIIIVYCQSGIRSKKAISILKENGYCNLYNLKGGLDSI